MLKSLLLKNFLRYRDLKIEFSDGVNIISGRSDKGKTSILRGKRWCRENWPQGFEFRYDPIIAGDKHPEPKKEDMTISQLTFDNGIVTRSRNEKGVNKYTVQLSGKKMESFTDLREIPEQVTKLINIPSYMVQDQHDTYFLLQDTPGEVAKKLNSISGLDIIDGTLKNISSMERECGRELKRIKGEIEEEQISLDKLKFLDNAAPLIEGINIEYKEMVNFKGILDSLLGIQSSHAAIIGELGVIKGWLRVEGLYLDIKQEMDQRGKLQGELELLQSLSDQIGDYSVRVKELSGWLEVEKDRNELLELLEKKTGLAIKLSELQRQLKAAEETESSLGNAQDRLKEKKERYKGLLVDSMICPWCGGQVDEESLERHLGEVL